MVLVLVVLLDGWSWFAEIDNLIHFCHKFCLKSDIVIVSHYFIEAAIIKRVPLSSHCHSFSGGHQSYLRNHIRWNGQHKSVGFKLELIPELILFCCY